MITTLIPASIPIEEVTEARLEKLADAVPLTAAQKS